MDLTAHGARFLKDLPWTRLWRWMVYSRVTTSCSAERVLPPVYGFGEYLGMMSRLEGAHLFLLGGGLSKRSAFHLSDEDERRLYHFLMCDDDNDELGPN
jgi:hypothetical protein